MIAPNSPMLVPPRPCPVPNHVSPQLYNLYARAMLNEDRVSRTGVKDTNADHTIIK